MAYVCGMSADQDIVFPSESQIMSVKICIFEVLSTLSVNLSWKTDRNTAVTYADIKQSV